MTTLERPRTIVHTHTAPDGTVVIIRDVPVRVRVDGDGREHFRYSLSVAQRVDQVITSALKNNKTQGNTIPTFFNERIEEPDVDVQLRMRGPEVRYGQATVKVWKKAFDRIYAALSAVQKSLSDLYEFKSLTGFPVTYATDGSLLIGLRKSDSRDLFEGHDHDVNGQTIDLIIKTAEWLSTENADIPPFLKEHPKVLDAALRAIEELSPASRDEISQVLVEDKRSNRPNRRLQLNSLTRTRAVRERVRAAIDNGHGERQQLYGVIFQVNINGSIRIKDIAKALPEINSKTVSAYVNEDLLYQVLEHMKEKKVVRLEGIIKPKQKGQKRFEIIDIQEVENSAEI